MVIYLVIFQSETLSPSSVAPDLNAGKVSESTLVGTDNEALGGSSRGGYEEIMGAPWSSLSSHVDQQFGVRLGYGRVVIDYRDRT